MANTQCSETKPPRIELKIRNGVVLVGGDAHYWHTRPTPAHRAFCKFAKDLEPRVVVMNGDAFDGARISRHPSIGWEKSPLVAEELAAVSKRLAEIQEASPQSSRLVWPLGNHDSRFETRLASVAQEYARVRGFHLKDHLDPRWEPCWSLWINGDTVVKHRTSKSGVHAAYNNALHSGHNIITGHTHQLTVRAVADYSGTVRWGAEHGCLADPYGQQFSYTEDNPRNWQAGFLVLTFRDGALLQPEIVRVVGDSKVDFRGELVRI